MACPHLEARQAINHEILLKVHTGLDEEGGGND